MKVMIERFIRLFFLISPIRTDYRLREEEPVEEPPREPPEYQPPEYPPERLIPEL